MGVVDWSVVTGLGIGLGLPALGGLFIIVRMENRVTQLENSRAEDQHWRNEVTATLTDISKNLNQLIGRELKQ